ncbi:hypothetical protein ACJJTC_002924 [Scirpophaga incertulas]
MMLVDDDGELVNVDRVDARNEQQIILQRTNDADFLDNGSVSSIHKCQSVDAKKLCIYDLKFKWKTDNNFDIGGTYSDNEADLWFYFTTSTWPNHNYLLNLFVCHRRQGTFSIGVSNSNEVRNKDRSHESAGWSIMPRTLTWSTFKSSKPEHHYHITTFCFTEKNINDLKNNILFIPISITMNSSPILNNSIIKAIKLKHNLSELLSKNEPYDFALESKSKKKFPVHKLVVAAHCPILRNLIKKSEASISSLVLDVSDEDIQLLIEFIYTGTIKNVFNLECMNLLHIASKFQLNNLFLLVQHAIAEQIYIENAVEIALLAQKFKLEKLMATALSFIKNNPKVLTTDGWKNLKDVTLAKQLIQHIYQVGV